MTRAATLTPVGRAEKITELQRQGRDCRGPAENGCAIRATRKVCLRMWDGPRRGMGQATDLKIPMCGKHAKATDAKGENFQTVRIEKF